MDCCTLKFNTYGPVHLSLDPPLTLSSELNPTIPAFLVSVKLRALDHFTVIARTNKKFGKLQRCVITWQSLGSRRCRPCEVASSRLRPSDGHRRRTSPAASPPPGSP